MRRNAMIAAMLAGAGCIGTLGAAGAQPRAWRPQAVRSMAGTLPPSGEGRRDFLKLNCYGCHGLNARGGIAMNIGHADPGDINEAVLQGEDQGMPSFRAYVTSTDIANITAYLHSIGTPSEPTWVDWWNAVP